MLYKISKLIYTKYWVLGAPLPPPPPISLTIMFFFPKCLLNMFHLKGVDTLDFFIGFKTIAFVSAA